MSSREQCLFLYFSFSYSFFSLRHLFLLVAISSFLWLGFYGLCTLLNSVYRRSAAAAAVWAHLPALMFAKVNRRNGAIKLFGAVVVIAVVVGTQNNKNTLPPFHQWLLQNTFYIFLQWLKKSFSESWQKNCSLSFSKAANFCVCCFFLKGIDINSRFDVIVVLIMEAKWQQCLN